MSYIPTEWRNGVTPINEENLNKIEEQLVALTEENEQLKADLETADGIIAQLEVDLATLESKNLKVLRKEITGTTSSAGNLGLELDSSVYDIVGVKVKTTSNATAYIGTPYRSVSTGEWTIKVLSVQTNGQITNTDVVVSVTYMEIKKTEESEQTE